MTYQKPEANYGSLPHGGSPASSGSDEAQQQPPPSTKASSRGSIMAKCAILTATLVGGILVGSAISGHSQSWVEKGQVLKNQASHQSKNPVVACENDKKDDEAGTWAKIKQASLGK